MKKNTLFRMFFPVLCKGHYLIYSFIDLNWQTHQSFSIIDRKAVNYMKTVYLPTSIMHLSSHWLPISIR